MDSDIPLPDFTLLDLYPAPFDSQLKIPDSGVPFPDVPSVIGHFGFALIQDSPIRCSQNSSVYPAVDRVDDICALKISRIQPRLLTEFHNRLVLGECPFLVSSYDVFQTDDYAILQMEFCPGGDVHAQQLSELECWQLLAAIGHALAHIHSNEFIHLDVSPSNIFRSESGFKLGDFGTLKLIGEFKPGDEGAGAYAAPEAFTNPERVSWEVDVFALGVCLLEAVSGHFAPRGGEVRYAALRRGEFGLGGDEYPCQVSAELRQVVNAMISPDPDGRPSAELIAATAEWALEQLKY